MTMQAKPTKETTLQREQQVWELRTRCYSQHQIAQQLGISEEAVAQILKRVRDRLAQQYQQGALQMRIDQTEQLFHIAQEALTAWELSKQPPQPQPHPQPVPTPPQDPASQATSASSSSPSQPDATQGTESVSKQSGKSIYLRTALQALSAVRAIWGLEAAEKAKPPVDPQQGVKRLIGVSLDDF